MKEDDKKFKNKTVQWIDDRLPIFSVFCKKYGQFPVPKNLNYMSVFGGISILLLFMMIVSGIFLAMHYMPHQDMAFASVEHIMRDVNYGWLLRSVHSNGASFFFMIMYMHIFRGLYYGSYKKPRELVWIIGLITFVLMMKIAFIGYALPWSQMSGWATTVITSMFTAVPLVGEDLVKWVWGGHSIGTPTLNRFFVLHCTLPFLLVAVVGLHMWAIHFARLNNPTGVDPKTKGDTVPFHPFYTVKNTFALVAFLLIFMSFVFFAPFILVSAEHYIEFNPLVTPEHIVPEWYFLPFYSILRSFTTDIVIPFTDIVLLSAKLQGVLAMMGSIIVLFFVPWLDTSPVRSSRYRPIYKKCFWLLVIVFVALGYSGANPPVGFSFYIGCIATFYYFAHFLVIMPLLGKHEKTLPEPESISADFDKKEHN